MAWAGAGLPAPQAWFIAEAKLDPSMRLSAVLLQEGDAAPAATPGLQSMGSLPLGSVTRRSPLTSLLHQQRLFGSSPPRSGSLLQQQLKDPSNGAAAAALQQQLQQQLQAGECGRHLEHYSSAPRSDGAKPSLTPVAAVLRRGESNVCV